MSPRQPDLARRLGQNVVVLRHRADLLQEMVAERSGLHRTHIGYLERGLRLPQLDTIIKVAGESCRGGALRTAVGDVVALGRDESDDGFAEAVLMDMRLTNRFGRNLKICREHAGLSQQELGELIEMHRTEVSPIERGQRLPRLDTILKLSAGVAVEPCVLLAGMHWRPGYYVAGDFTVADNLTLDDLSAEGRLREMGGRKDALPFSDELSRVLGLNVRKHRQRLGISQDELADSAEIHRTAVSPLELGEVRPRIEGFIRIAGALGAAPNDLVAGVVWMPPERRVLTPGAFEITADAKLEEEIAALRRGRRS